VLRNRTVLTLAATLVAIGALAYVGPRLDAPAPLAALVSSWPTLWFAAGLVLAGTAVARTASARLRAAVGWTAVTLATEAVQRPALASFLFPDGPGAGRFHPASYAHHGTFDVLDVVAALLGAAIGWALAVAMHRDGAPARAANHRVFGFARRGALLAVAAAATLATSPPPGPYVSVTLEPSVVCEGEEVRVAWIGHGRDGEEPPDQAVLNAEPPDAFVPPLVERAVAVPGTLDVVAERSGGVAATPNAYGVYGGLSTLVHVRPCDAAGRQYRHEDAWNAVALAAVPGGADVVAALRGDGAHDRLVRLDADANEVATALVTGGLDGRVRAVAVAPDGTVVAVGWRELRTETAIGTEAVVWRWPVGGEPDAGTVVGPTAPDAFAEAAAVAIDATGRTWVAWTEGPPGATVAMIAGYAPDGTLETTRTLATDPVTEAHALTVDDAGRPTLVALSAASAAGTRTVVLHALDVDGAVRWTRGPYFWNRAAIASAAPGTTLLLVPDALHALDDATGTTLWTTEFPEGRSGTLLTVDGAGAPVVAGGGTFVQRYGADGTPASGRTFGSAAGDVPLALTWSGGAVVAGWTKGALATTLDPDGLAEAFVLRFPDGAP